MLCLLKSVSPNLSFYSHIYEIGFIATTLLLMEYLFALQFVSALFDVYHKKICPLQNYGAVGHIVLQRRCILPKTGLIETLVGDM